MAELKQIVPFSLKDAPALIEKLLPAQKLSVEAAKEQEGRQSKTLTTLGSFWKGRKPLILNKACILGALLPATNDLKNDLKIFEKLMSMDDESFVVRLGRIKPSEIVERVTLLGITECFDVEPKDSLPNNSPFRIDEYRTPEGKLPKLTWKESIPDFERRKIEALALPSISYRELVQEAARPETCGDDVHNHIWKEVNEYLGTQASSMPELVEQLGIMRFGRRPKVADTFAGSGQIPFEAARLGCDVYASDLNPVSCMLNWGAFNVIGASEAKRDNLRKLQQSLVDKVQSEIDYLKIETDGKGSRPKVFLYCLESTCPQSGWSVPLLPTFVVSKGHSTIARLVPDFENRRYDIEIISGVSAKEFKTAETGTIQGGYLVHEVNGKSYRTKISTVRGDFNSPDGSTQNKLRMWEKLDYTPREDDVFRERLFCILWQFTVIKKGKEKTEYEFRSVTKTDLLSEQKVIEYVGKNLSDWQNNGWVPDMKIESGFNTDQPIREKGWAYWHHLFNPRQLLTCALINKHSSAEMKFGFTQVLNNNCKLSRWNWASGIGQTASVFDNQALNTLYNYGCRGMSFCIPLLTSDYKSFPLPQNETLKVCNHPADKIDIQNDIYITDPPYGDAVKYEEILEFFIAWFRKNPPTEFSEWIWDSRRSLAIKGEDEDFRRSMVNAYKRMAEKMPDNGLQVIMFTHQSGSIWADMANIVWASGLQVTAAWYVVTETDSALREGSYVKGTILLVLRKRQGSFKTSRSDLAWEIQEEVELQVQTLTGLNQEAKDLYRDENLFSDADLQMAGYAAALRVLTRYSIIDGKEMASEAVRPRVKGQTTFVDELIEFAVGVANEALVPLGIEKLHWDSLKPAERFYLKMIELEALGAKTIDNYQNFAKAFKVKNFQSFMASEKANAARLKSSDEFGRSEMSGESEMANTVLRGILYGIMELMKETDGDEVIKHMSNDNIPDYFKNKEMVAEISDYLANKLEGIRPDEASSARVLRDLVRNQKWGQ